MGFMIVIAAAVLAYLAGGLALSMGAGWLMSLAVLSGTGVAFSRLFMCALVLRDTLGRRESDHKAPVPLR